MKVTTSTTIIKIQKYSADGVPICGYIRNPNVVTSCIFLTKGTWNCPQCASNSQWWDYQPKLKQENNIIYAHQYCPLWAEHFTKHTVRYSKLRRLEAELKRLEGVKKYLDGVEEDLIDSGLVNEKTTAILNNWWGKYKVYYSRIKKKYDLLKTYRILYKR